MKTRRANSDEILAFNTFAGPHQLRMRQIYKICNGKLHGDLAHEHRSLSRKIDEYLKTNNMQLGQGGLRLIVKEEDNDRL